MARSVDETCLALRASANDGGSLSPLDVLRIRTGKFAAVLVHTANGVPLPIEHGGPVRMITPQLYAWKGAKWIRRLELLRENKLGFWEERGYSSTAHPWREDRYS